MCATLIAQKEIVLPESATLLNHIRSYLRERARFKEAIPILELAVKLSEQLFGPNDLHTATALHNLAVAHRELIQHDRAQPLYERALAIHQQHLGLYHPDVAVWRHTFAIRKYTLGLGHPDTQKILGHLREMYEEQNLGTQIEELIDELQAQEPDELQEEYSSL